MIVIRGIGVDIVEVARIQEALKEHGQRFVQRILSASELCDYERSVTQAQFLAKRFAMKEAFAKALGTGMREAVSFNQISIVHDALGKPIIQVSKELEPLLEGVAVHISVSDEKNTVVAFSVIEGLPFHQ